MRNCFDILFSSVISYGSMTNLKLTVSTVWQVQCWFTAEVRWLSDYDLCFYLPGASTLSSLPVQGQSGGYCEYMEYPRASDWAVECADLATLRSICLPAGWWSWCPGVMRMERWSNVMLFDGDLFSWAQTEDSEYSLSISNLSLMVFPLSVSHC